MGNESQKYRAGSSAQSNGAREAGRTPSGTAGSGSQGRGERQAPRGQSGKKKKARRKPGVLGVILRILLILILAAAVAAGVLVWRMRSVLQDFHLNQVDSVNLEQQLLPGIPYLVRNDEVIKGYQNIALFGVDSRTGDLLSGDNRSDTIMVCSINKKTGKIKLVSVFRDTYMVVEEGNGTSNTGVCGKANSAYALGGPVQAINMLNRSLDLDIVDFVTVGFEGLAHTIDALGGIEIELDEEERGYLNQYIRDMHLELGTEEDYVEESGLVPLSGIQATAYSRIRYTAGDDFRRAERQREVLKKTMEKAKTASPSTLVEVANSVVGDMATSLSTTEILGLILKAQSFELEGTGGFPQEEYRTFGNNWEDGSFILPLTLVDNVVWLHDFLFDQKNYSPSDEVRVHSERILNAAGYSETN